MAAPPIAAVAIATEAVVSPVTASADPPHDVLGLPAGGECWSVLHTLSRREKKVARAWEHAAIRHYLPLPAGRSRGVRQPTVDGPSTGSVPLFPGYIFACLAPAARTALFRTGMIAQTIAVPRPQVLLAELRQIRSALETGADLTPVPAIERGMQVRVIGGPLDGVVGHVGERRGRRGRLWLILNVTLLGSGARVVVDARDVEPLGASVVASPGGMI
jgi:transcription antitermination factor NusG